MHIQSLSRRVASAHSQSVELKEFSLSLRMDSAAARRKAALEQRVLYTRPKPELLVVAPHSGAAVRSFEAALGRADSCRKDVLSQRARFAAADLERVRALQERSVMGATIAAFRLVATGAAADRRRAAVLRRKAAVAARASARVVEVRLTRLLGRMMAVMRMESRQLSADVRRGSALEARATIASIASLRVERWRINAKAEAAHLGVIGEMKQAMHAARKRAWLQDAAAFAKRDLCRASQVAQRKEESAREAARAAAAAQQEADARRETALAAKASKAWQGFSCSQRRVVM